MVILGVHLASWIHRFHKSSGCPWCLWRPPSPAAAAVRATSLAGISCRQPNSRGSTSQPLFDAWVVGDSVGNSSWKCFCPLWAATVRWPDSPKFLTELWLLSLPSLWPPPWPVTTKSWSKGQPAGLYTHYSLPKSRIVTSCSEQYCQMLCKPLFISNFQKYICKFIIMAYIIQVGRKYSKYG